SPHSSQVFQSRAGCSACAPADARRGEPARELAGAQALQPARDWKTWLLWGLLVLGALVIGGFALSLLRGRTGTEA
ncbi:MAG: DUF3999 family protein, partial [Pseudomonas sp.]